MADSKDSQNSEEHGPPDLLTSLIVGAFFSRARVALWLATILGIACMSYFGNQNAGSYAGYDAGSIMDPLSYEDTVWTSMFGDRSGMTDDELNDTLSNMRGKYYPGFLAGLATIALSVVSAAAVGFSYQGVVLIFEAIERDSEYRAWLSKAYDRDNGTGSYEHDNSSLVWGTKVYAYATKALFMTWADHGIPGTSIDEDIVKSFREGFDNSLLLRVFLWSIGTRRTLDGHLRAFLPGAEGKWPSAPDGVSDASLTHVGAEPSGFAVGESAEKTSSTQHRGQSEESAVDADAAKMHHQVIVAMVVIIFVLAVASILVPNIGAFVSSNTPSQTSVSTDAADQSVVSSVSSTSDSDEIADKVEKIKFGSDGTTGTYDDIPDTDLKQIWIDTSPQGWIEGLTYSISKDGHAITLECDQYEMPSGDMTFHRMVSELVAATMDGYDGTDRFFQNPDGTWYEQSDNGYTAMSRANASVLTLIITDK